MFFPGVIAEKIEHFRLCETRKLKPQKAQNCLSFINNGTSCCSFISNNETTQDYYFYEIYQVNFFKSFAVTMSTFEKPLALSVSDYA